MFFFFNDTATTEIYTLSLHDALPISRSGPRSAHRSSSAFTVTVTVLALIASAAHAGLSRIPSDGYNTPAASGIAIRRSEEHTSELQSQSNLVCRLLLEKKKNAHFVPILFSISNIAFPHTLTEAIPH